MSPDGHSANVAKHASDDVVRAVIAANRCGDAAQCAFDIVSCAALVAGDDPVTKTAVALFMLRMAARLDSDVTSTTTLQ